MGSGGERGGLNLVILWLYLLRGINWDLESLCLIITADVIDTTCWICRGVVRMMCCLLNDHAFVK